MSRLPLVGRVARTASAVVNPVRRHRRRGAHDGVAHIEVKALGQPEQDGLRSGIGAAVRATAGVSWSEINAVTGQLIVAFYDDQVDLDGLLSVVEAVEDAHGLSQTSFELREVRHPEDADAIRRGVIGLVAD